MRSAVRLHQSQPGPRAVDANVEAQADLNHRTGHHSVHLWRAFHNDGVGPGRNGANVKSCYQHQETKRETGAAHLPTSFIRWLEGRGKNSVTQGRPPHATPFFHLFVGINELFQPRRSSLLQTKELFQSTSKRVRM